MHCYYVLNILMLNGETRGPQATGQKLWRRYEYDHIFNMYFYLGYLLFVTY